MPYSFEKCATPMSEVKASYTFGSNQVKRASEIGGDPFFSA